MKDVTNNINSEEIARLKKKVYKDFIDTFKPYKSFFQYLILRDLIQPVSGVGNFLIGLGMLVSIPFFTSFELIKFILDKKYKLVLMHPNKNPEKNQFCIAKEKENILLYSVIDLQGKIVRGAIDKETLEFELGDQYPKFATALEIHDLSTLKFFSQNLIKIASYNGHTRYLKPMKGKEILQFSWGSLMTSLMYLFRGTSQVVTAPLTWVFKIPIRFGITVFKGIPKIEDNPKIKKLAQEGREHLLVDGTDDQININASTKKILEKITVLHRKYSNGIIRGQISQIKCDNDSLYGKSINHLMTLPAIEIDEPISNITAKNALIIFNLFAPMPKETAKETSSSYSQSLTKCKAD